MKKAIAIIIVAALTATSAVALCACGNQNTAATEATQATAATAAASDKATEAVLSTQAADLNTSSQSSAVSQDSNSTTDTDSSAGTGGNYRSNSPVYKALYDTITTSGAQGYTTCKIDGSDIYQLLLSYGVAEAERYYELYSINADGITYQGQLEGAHTTAYIDYNTARLGIYYGHMGSYSYGPVSVVGGLHVETEESGQVGADESYPDIPGEAFEFTPTDNLASISVY